MSFRNPLPVFFACAFLFSCHQKNSAPVTPASPEEIAQESLRLNTFLDSVYDEDVKRDPERQTFLGLKMNYDAWTDRSDAHALAENEITRAELDRMLKGFDFDKLDEQARISYRLFE